MSEVYTSEVYIFISLSKLNDYVIINKTNLKLGIYLVNIYFIICINY